MMKKLCARLAAALLLLTGTAQANNLTPGAQVVTGSAVGQVAQAQPSTINYLFGTVWPSTASWTEGGAYALAATTSQWDAGFFPQVIQGTGTADYLRQSAAVMSGQAAIYTFSGQFSTSTAIYSAIAASASVTVGVAYYNTGVLQRTDTITFNPQTGQLTSATGGVTSVNIQLFQTTVPNQSAPFGNVGAPVFYVSFTGSAVPTGTNSATVTITPNALTGTKQVIAGGFQLEAAASASAFYPTSDSVLSSSLTRPVGSYPEQAVNRNLPAANVSSTTYRFNGIADLNEQIVLTQAGTTVNLCPATSAITTVQNGATVTIVNDNIGQATITSPCPGGPVIVGPGIATAGVTSLTFPPTGSNTYPNATITLAYDVPNTVWRVISTSMGTAAGGGGGGTGTPGGSTNDVQYNAGGGNFGGSNAFTWSGTLPVVINGNAAALPSPVTGTLFQFGQADATGAHVLLYGFGNNGTGAAPDITGFRTQGTNASPTVPISGTGLISMGGASWNGAAYTNEQVSISFLADDTWTSTDTGTRVTIFTTADGTTTNRQVAAFGNDATLMLGVAGTTKGQISFANATSGSITISPPTGALGTIAQTWLAAAGVEAVTTGTLTAGDGATFDSSGRIIDTGSAAGTGTVTSVSVTTANGVSGTVATATTTPAITLALGNITPTSVTGIVNSNGLLTQSGFETGLTGGASQGSLTASATKSIHILTTCASGSGITLPSSSSTSTNGQIHTVLNNGASNSCKVWPDSGGNLGDGTNAALTIVVNASCSFIQTAVSTWKPLWNCPATAGTSNTVLAVNADGTTSTSVSSTIAVGTTINMGSTVFCPNSPPTISSGFASTGTIVHGATPCAFSVSVGAGGGSSGVIGLPTATNEWECSVTLFNPSSAQLLNTTEITARSASSVTVTNVVTSTGVAAAWPSGQVLMMDCGGA